MGEVVSIDEARAAQDRVAATSFAEYVAAKTKADETLDLADARLAAKAWKRFLEHYCGRF